MANRFVGWRNRPISRRGLLQAGGVAAAGAGAIALGACGNGDKSEVAGASNRGGFTKGPVEQQKQRRWGTGVKAWDPTKTFDGYTLFAPSLGNSAYVVDMEGSLINQWDITSPDEKAKVWTVRLLESGNIFVIVHENSGNAPDLVFQGGHIMELDWNGKEVWRFDDPEQHHDAQLLPNGNLLILRAEPIPPEIAARVQGGIPGTEDESMWSDYVVETTMDGEVVWEWHAWEHLDPAEDILNPQDTRAEWTHANSVAPTLDGDMLISFRNINTVLIASRDSGEVTWKLNTPMMANLETQELAPSRIGQQHDAHMLPNGNVMIFDNGAHRWDNAVPYSRVIEVNPETDEIERAFFDITLYNFFSPFISGAQRLENDNTLICEGNFGRIFEVDSQNQIVWEYVSPYFTTNPFLGENNGVFRAYRHPEDAFNKG